MNQDFSLHTHTIEFDGKNTAQDMIDVAKQYGVKTVGISNHFIVHPDIKKTKFYTPAVLGGYANMYNSCFDDAVSQFDAHYKELERISKQSDIKILRGMELDLFDSHDWHNGYLRAVKTLKPEYIIGSAHFIEYGGCLCNIHDIKHAQPDDQEKMLKAYWEKIQWIARSGLCTFLAHIDLPARLGLGTDEKWADIEQESVAVIAKSKIPVEINTALYKHKTNPHPSPRIMKMCADNKIPMFLSDDAHHVSQVCQYFDDAKQYAENLGVNLVGLNKIL